MKASRTRFAGVVGAVLSVALIGAGQGARLRQAASAAQSPPTLLGRATPESVGMSSERLARIRPVVEEYVNHRRIAGAVTLIM
ncbi:MAG TPA: hypothetical protein VFV34_08245, partial [Blastocatellia bacterium]|nr:hypothetical protein [Blastocatellia bacterium]